MTTSQTRKDGNKAVPVSHRAQPPRGLALAVAELNEAEWYETQRAAILGMDMVDQMEAGANATPAERETLRIQRRTAFAAIRDIGLMAGELHRLNKYHIEMKTDTAPVNDAIADVKKAQRERKAGAK